MLLIPNAINIYPCVRGFFIVDFENLEGRQCILDSNPWFWEKSGLFMRPWNPSFNPSTTIITSVSTNLGEIAKPTLASLEFLFAKSHWKCNWEILL